MFTSFQRVSYPLALSCSLCFLLKHIKSCCINFIQGYVGPQCENQVDECQSRPCLNGGFCVDGVGRFTCICPVGFTDAVCGTDIDACRSKPCLNGATCIDRTNGYSCQCATGSNVCSYPSFDFDHCLHSSIGLVTESKVML